MSASSTEVWKLAAGLGWLAGMRSASAPAAFSYRVARHPAALRGTPFAPLASSRVRTLLTLSALGEFVVDKLPITPSRTDPGPLAGRVGSGALVGAAAFAAHGRPALIGAAIGGGAAFLSTHTLYRLRVAASDNLGIPNLAAGLLEDVAAVALGRFLARSG
ncbi:MAG TPA: DUF4126 family protein [Chloroflexia bacterium]